MDNIRKIIRSANIFFVSAGVFTYVLGAVLARRSGREVDFGVLILGLALFLALYLLERSLNYLTSSQVNIFSTAIRSNKLKSPELTGFLLFLAFILVFCLYGLVRIGAPAVSSWMWLLLLTLGILINMTSIRLWRLPYRWLTDGLVISPIMLFTGAVLQRIPSERMLFFLSFPLFFLYLASYSATLFEKSGTDAEKSRPSLVTFIGWEKAMNLHHVLLIGAYVTLGVYFQVSGSWSIAWPAALVAMISLFEVFQLERIARGLKPLWGLLRATSVLQYLSILYILLFAFLTN